MFANADAPGFRGASRAHDVSRLIRYTERLVADLGLVPTDLERAREALHAAKVLFAAQNFSEAAAQAKRAGVLAVSLNDRFNAYVAAWRDLQTCIGELEGIGFPTDSFETSVREAERAMTRWVEEEGSLVPDYRGATAQLEKAAEKARTILIEARQSTREILLASLAIEALSEARSLPSLVSLIVSLEGTVEEATRELALGHASEAFQLASEARRRAEEVLVIGLPSRGLAAAIDELSVDVDAVSRAADAPEDGLAAVDQGVPRGRLQATVWQQTPTFMEKVARTRQVLEHAEQIHAQLRAEGYALPDVDEALAEAHRAMETDDWERVRESLRRALRTVVTRRDERISVAREISELRERVTRLKDFHLPFLLDVEDVLERAREELRSGRPADAKDFLICAAELLSRATRSGSPQAAGVG